MTTSITSATALLGPLGGRMADHVSGHHFYIEHARSFGSVAVSPSASREHRPLQPGANARYTVAVADVPEQIGRTAVVTGASRGIGLQTARGLASRGARVVLACRERRSAENAAAAIRRTVPASEVEVVCLDLASLDAARTATERLRSTHARLDLLTNNAAVMEPPHTRTVDGFELTFATNHLGHFAITGLLLDLLLATPNSRIVTVSSERHARAAMNFEDLQAERDYDPGGAYCQSKLANLLFTYELDRRLRAAGAATSALACHPGIVLTNLYKHRTRLERALLSPRLRMINSRLVHSVEMGALPALRAATDDRAQGGEFYGPPGRGATGHPVPGQSSARSHDLADQQRLWQSSERLTGVTYPV